MYWIKFYESNASQVRNSSQKSCRAKLTKYMHEWWYSTNLLNEADHRPKLCPELMDLGIFYLFNLDAIKPMKDQQMWVQKYSKCCSFCELSIELGISLNTIFKIQSFILTLFWSVLASMLFILIHRKFKFIR